MKYKTRNNVILFSQYLIEHNITNVNEIKKILLNNTFSLRDIGAHGNNYGRFIDTDGILTFNNPDMNIETTSLDRGVVAHGVIGGTGNNLRYDNLYLILNEENKKDIINSIIKIEEEIKLLEKEKQEFKDKLGYLIEINTDILNIKEYEQFNKEKITQNLLHKSSNIAVVKT